MASLIPDGATLQMGIGGIPDAVLACLANHSDLGIHTEMFSDGVIPLIEMRRHQRRAQDAPPRASMVAGFVLGTRKLFDFIDDNPLFEFHPIRYVNDPFVIAQNERMVAINSAHPGGPDGAGLRGFASAREPYSGFGGQVDFIRGAARSRGRQTHHRPALDSAMNGAISTIVPMLDPGAGVVTSRADVHYVVTEHGIAYLHGKTLRERAEALIAIADPKFREQLTSSHIRAHYLEPQTSPVS